LKNPIAQYIKKTPQVKKQYIAKKLGISRPTLDSWINRPTEKFTVEELEKIKGL